MVLKWYLQKIDICKMRVNVEFKRIRLLGDSIQIVVDESTPSGHYKLSWP